MKIHCRVIRKNGTHQTVHVDAKKKEFDLDKNTYFIRGFNFGRLFGAIPWLTATYLEGYALPLHCGLIDKDDKFKLDTKAIKNATNKKILNVFGESELTKLEQILIMFAGAGVGVGIVNVMIGLQIYDILSKMVI